MHTLLHSQSTPQPTHLTYLMKIAHVTDNYKKIINGIMGTGQAIFHLFKSSSRLYSAQKQHPHVGFSWGCSVDDRCTFGKNVKIFSHTLLSNSRVDDFTYIGGNCVLMNCRLGKFCSIAPGVLIGLGKHPVSESISTYPGFYKGYASGYTKFAEAVPFKEYEEITIANDVWIGAGAILLDGITVGNGAIIGAGSVVTKNVEPFEVVGGCPAKHIKWRFDKADRIRIQETKWWARRENFLRENGSAFFTKKQFFSVFETNLDKNKDNCQASVVKTDQ